LGDDYFYCDVRAAVKVKEILDLAWDLYLPREVCIALGEYDLFDESILRKNNNRTG